MDSTRTSPSVPFDPVEAREKEFLAAMAEADPDAPLQVFTREREGFPVLALEGELDLYTIEHLRTALSQSLAGDPKGVVFDFSYLTYLDSTGLAIVLKATKILAGRVAVVTSKDRVRRLFEMTGLTKQLHLCRTLPEALLSLKVATEEG